MLIDRDFLRGGLLGLASGKNRREASRISRLILQPGALDILAWRINSGDPELTLSALADTGHQWSDRLKWFMENAQEIIEALQIIIDLFSGMFGDGQE